MPGPLPVETLMATAARPLLAALLLASGCTWVSAKDFAEAQTSLDNDGDGYNSADDCDDTDVNVSPKATEVWYDGIDADCAGDDDYDADGDGYVDAAYEGLATEGVPGSGSLRSGDCDDADPNIYPGASDTWYDGIDTDCAGDDDFDADGDGAPQDTDCADDDPRVYPGAEDAWYDGIDADCAGDSDFDADGDGVAPEGLGGRPTAYTDVVIDAEGDCDDTNPDISPAATETWYNGVDDDCDAETVDDDFDRDGIPADMATGGSPDCDDTDALVYPDADEVLSSGSDKDCDGDPTGFASAGIESAGPLLDPTGSATISGLRRLRLAVGDAHLWLGLAADTLTLPLYTGDETRYDAIVALGVPLDATHRGVTRRQVLLTHATPPTAYALTDGFDFSTAPTTDSTGSPADLLYAAHGLAGTTVELLRIAGFDDAGNEFLGASTPLGVGTSDVVSLFAADDGSVQAVACNDSSFSTLHATRAGLSTGTTSDVATVAEGLTADVCQLDGTDLPTLGLFTSTSTGALQAYSFTAGAVGGSVTGPSSVAADVVAADIPERADGRFIATLSSTGTVTVHAPDASTADLAGVTASTVHAMVTGDSVDSSNPTLVVSGASGSGDGWFAVGSVSGGFDVYPVGTGGDVSDAAVFVDDGGRVHAFFVEDDVLLYGSALL